MMVGIFQQQMYQPVKGCFVLGIIKGGGNQHSAIFELLDYFNTFINRLPN